MVATPPSEYNRLRQATSPREFDRDANHVPYRFPQPFSPWEFDSVRQPLSPWEFGSKPLSPWEFGREFGSGVRSQVVAASSKRLYYGNRPFNDGRQFMVQGGLNQGQTPRRRPSVKEQRVVKRSKGATTARTSTTPTTKTATKTSSRTRDAEKQPLPIGKKLALPAVIFIAAVVIAIIALVAFALTNHSPQQTAANDQSADSATTTTNQPGKATGPYSVSFTTTGDLIFWREVADYIDKNGGESAMANIAEHLAAADVTISNLESPLSDDESEPIIDKDVYIIGRPSAIESMKNSDITMVSLANNHIMDYTGPALEDTLDALDDAGILHAGAGMTEDEASEIAEMTVNGASIALLSWTDIIPNFFLAHNNEPGVVTARLDMDGACRRVREAKATHDIVIVAMHWGVEYEDYITDYLQSEPAHKLVDAGADVILGNHPHVMQGVEFYKGALIAYAHGNCVFWQKYDHTHESILLDFDITQDGISNVIVTPLYLDDKYGIPDFATDSQAKQTLSRLEEISQGMNTAFDIHDGKAFISPIE